MTVIITPSDATDEPWARAVAGRLPLLQHTIFKPTIEELLEVRRRVVVVV